MCVGRGGREETLLIKETNGPNEGLNFFLFNFDYFFRIMFIMLLSSTWTMFYLEILKQRTFTKPETIENKVENIDLVMRVCVVRVCANVKISYISINQSLST